MMPLSTTILQRDLAFDLHHADDQMMLTNTVAKAPLAFVLPVSLVSTVGSVVLTVWLTMGTSGGVFWGAFGSRQYAYYLVVVVIILTALCVSRLGEFSNARLMGACAIGGYGGGLLAYCLLAYPSLAEMVARGHYYALARPFLLPTHIIFICAGMIAALLLMAGCIAYDALTAPRHSV